MTWASGTVLDKNGNGRDEARAIRKIAKGSDMLAMRLGAMWPCGHYRRPETTQTVAGVARCRTCRRKRWYAGFRRACRVVELRTATRERVREIKRKMREDADQQLRRMDGPLTRLVISLVSSAMDVMPDDIVGHNRIRAFTKPRFMAVKLMRDLTYSDGSQRFSLPQIGKLVGGRDHSTIVNAITTCDIHRERDPAYSQTYDCLRAALVAEGYIVERPHG